eukprot:PhF_6_TR3139/c0_g1_i1/m.4544/K01527/EGD1, BTF3; nascent polypeptide-associated complex subunit beta
MSGITKEMLAKRAELVRTGGKGSVRRKSKGVHKSSGAEDKKLQATLKRLGVNSIGECEEVNFFREDNTVLHFTNPKVEANIPAHTYVVKGKPETKKLADILPQVLSQLGTENAEQLKNIAKEITKSE